MKFPLAITGALLAMLALPPAAHAQGIPGGIVHGINVGGQMAGPVGAIVGGAVGGAVGGVEGLFGLDWRYYNPPAQYRRARRIRRHR